MNRRGIILLLTLVVVAVAVWLIRQDRPPKGGGFPPPSALRLVADGRTSDKTLDEMLSRKGGYYEYRTDWESRSYASDRKARQAASKKPKKVKESQFIKIYPFSAVEEYEEPAIIKNYASISNIPPPKEWEHVGVKGMGVVTSVAVDPKNVKHWVIGTDGSGLYRSINFGKTWKKLDFPRNDARHVFLDPADPKHYTVWGEKGYPIYAAPRLYESLDAGKTWSAGSLPPEQHNVVDVAMTPKGILVVAVNQVLANTYDIMQRVDALGNVYTLRKTMIAFDSIRLKMKPSGFGLTGFRTGVGVGAAAKIFYVVYLTDDHGETWAPVFSNLAYPDYFAYAVTAYDITPDGKRLVVALEDPEGVQPCVLAHSSDGGGTWEFVEVEGYVFEAFGDTISKKTEAKDDLRAQDIALDAENEDYVAVFRYMRGLYDSYDRGGNFTKIIDASQDIAVMELASGGANIIEPVDLRTNNMAVFDFGGARNFLMPTDQGLFAYRDLNGAEHTLTNAAPGLYLGDSGTVTVTACPRIYTGLWHVGSYWINPDDSIEGFLGGENWGYGAGEDDACDTPVFSAVHGYLSDGRNLNFGKTNWFHAALDFGWPIPQTFRYMDGWWYTWKVQEVPSGVAGKTDKMNKLLRLDDDFSTFEYLAPLGNDKTGALVTFALSEEDGLIWYMDVKQRLWSKDGEEDWQMVKNMVGWTADPSAVAGIFAEEGRLVIYGSFGAILSSDGGETWKKPITGKRVRAVTSDRCGALYAAAEPIPNMGKLGGVSRSSTGKSFSKLGTGDEKSYINSLSVDHANDVLYAATQGESLMRFALEPCGE